MYGFERFKFKLSLSSGIVIRRSGSFFELSFLLHPGRNNVREKNGSHNYRAAEYGFPLKGLLAENDAEKYGPYVFEREYKTYLIVVKILLRIGLYRVGVDGVEYAHTYERNHRLAPIHDYKIDVMVESREADKTQKRDGRELREVYAVGIDFLESLAYHHIVKSESDRGNYRPQSRGPEVVEMSERARENQGSDGIENNRHDYEFRGPSLENRPGKEGDYHGRKGVEEGTDGSVGVLLGYGEAHKRREKQNSRGNAVLYRFFGYADFFEVENSVSKRGYTETQKVDKRRRRPQTAVVSPF